jgi:hypothetical protein
MPAEWPLKSVGELVAIGAKRWPKARAHPGRMPGPAPCRRTGRARSVGAPTMGAEMGAHGSTTRRDANECDDLRAVSQAAACKTPLRSAQRPARRAREQNRHASRTVLIAGCRCRPRPHARPATHSGVARSRLAASYPHSAKCAFGTYGTCPACWRGEKERERLGLFSSLYARAPIVPKVPKGALWCLHTLAACVPKVPKGSWAPPWVDVERLTGWATSGRGALSLAD